MAASDPPCDFDAFVAERYGIDDERARALIRYWLANYVPRQSSTAEPAELRVNDGSLRAG